MSSSGSTPPAHEKPQTPGAGDVVQGLSDTAQTIGASLQTMQQALVGNMQQAAQMTLSMNKMMEELVRRSVQVGVYAQRTTAEGAKGSAARYYTGLRIEVKNQSPIPLQNMQVKLWFSARHGHDKSPQLKLAPELDSADGLGLGPVTAALPCQADHDREPFVQSLDGILLHSGASAKSALAVELDTLDQLNGRISVEFVSPGTGQTLSIGHKFGIHLTQLIDARSSGSSSNDVAENSMSPVDIPTFKVDLARLRRLFDVPPTDGIDQNAQLGISLGDTELALQVKDTHSCADGSYIATCAWLAPASELNPQLQRLLPLLTDELRASEPQQQSTATKARGLSK
ncbi:hypothetical protein GGF46_004153 [Coemansia sp. RSA 552]|nr:hypothetical protein GGF46_004153 [Coemansia sp. RSA 552]